MPARDLGSSCKSTHLSPKGIDTAVRIGARGRPPSWAGPPARAHPDGRARAAQREADYRAGVIPGERVPTSTVLPAIRQRSSVSQVAAVIVNGPLMRAGTSSYV